MQKIFIVEDDKNISEIEQFALKNVGYEVNVLIRQRLLRKNLIRNIRSL